MGDLSQTLARGLGACLLLALAVGAVADGYQAPTIDPADDARYLEGAVGTSPLFWPGELKVAGFRNMDKVSPVRRIEASPEPLSLPEAPRDLSSIVVEFEGETESLDEYFTNRHTAGLLVIHDGKVIYERYGLGNTRDSRWVSFSVAKSVVAMLIGAAIEDGYIASTDEKVTRYLPRLADSPYADVTIANLLQMASGVAWNEDYADPESDIASASFETLALYEYLNGQERVGAAGEVFNYNTAETNLAGTLLRAAIGNNLSTYLEEKIWRPFGMESAAYWQLTEPGGGEFGGCCINATLRDYGRIGLFALAEGRLADGTAVLPADWMAQSTAPSQGFAGYGYFWWLSQAGTYEASGIFGQGIHIVPEKRLVIAVHSAWEHAGRGEDFNRLGAVYRAISAEF
ncbi:MAG: serine hydrolase domain-containing protein [Pseudomonadota bacterium]